MAIRYILANGRRIRILTVVDDFVRESIKIAVDTSLNERRVCEELGQGTEMRGKLYQNGYIENFNGKLRDELNENIFVNLQEAKRLVKAWREEYNERRPSPLNGKTSNEVTKGGKKLAKTSN